MELGASNEPEINGPEVRFTHISHSAENAEHVWEGIKDADVILLENFGDSADAVTELEEYLNGNEHQKRLIKKVLLASEQDFGTQIMLKALENNKEIRFIDIREGEPGFAENMEEKHKKRQADAAFLDGQFDLAYAYYKTYSVISVDSIEKRDLTVSRQIREFVDDNRERLKGKTVVAIQGLAHLNTYHYFRSGSPGTKTSRSFLNGRITPFLMETEIHHRLVRGEDDKAEQLIKRDFISTYFIRLRQLEEYTTIPFEAANYFVRNLPNEQVDQIFSKLAEMQDYVRHIDESSTDKAYAHVFTQMYLKRHVDDISNGLHEAILKSRPWERLKG